MLPWCSSSGCTDSVRAEGRLLPDLGLKCEAQFLFLCTPLAADVSFPGMQGSCCGQGWPDFRFFGTWLCWIREERRRIWGEGYESALLTVLGGGEGAGAASQSPAAILLQPRQGAGWVGLVFCEAGQYIVVCCSPKADLQKQGRDLDTKRSRHIWQNWELEYLEGGFCGTPLCGSCCRSGPGPATGRAHSINVVFALQWPCDPARLPCLRLCPRPLLCIQRWACSRSWHSLEPPGTGDAGKAAAQPSPWPCSIS